MVMYGETMALRVPNFGSAISTINISAQQGFTLNGVGSVGKSVTMA